jgi:hypothetical protein
MAGTGNARGGLGWVILVVALAVPGVLFYSWWSHLKADREKSVAAKARGRVPDGGVFQPSPNVRLVNPMAPASSTAALAAPILASVAPVAPVAAVEPAEAAALAAEIPAPPAASSGTALGPPLKRDPMLSPSELARVLEEEDARRRADADLKRIREQAHNGSRPRAPKARDPKSLVRLQGIISVDEGFKAIVNGAVFGAGETVAGTKVKIVKITELTVTFDYLGTRFSKGVSRD